MGQYIGLKKVAKGIYTNIKPQTLLQENKQNLQNIKEQLKFIKPHIRHLIKKVKKLEKEKRALQYKIKNHDRGRDKRKTKRQP